MTRVNYNVVVEELMNGVVALDSHTALCINGPRHRQIAEFRTIGFTGTRQTGKTNWMCDFAAQHPGETLIVFHDALVSTDFQRRWESTMGDNQPPTTYRGPFYPADDRRGISFNPIRVPGQFKYVLIDDANRYFAKYSHDKTFKGIAEVAGDDVIVILVG